MSNHDDRSIQGLARRDEGSLADRATTDFRARSGHQKARNAELGTRNKAALHPRSALRAYPSGGSIMRGYLVGLLVFSLGKSVGYR